MGNRAVPARSIYIDELDESNQSIGYFVGFEASEDKLRLCFKADDCDPFLHHEFDFRQGLSLAEIAEAYAFSNSISEDLIQCYCRRYTQEARQKLTEASRDVAKRVLLFVVVFLSDDFGHSAFGNQICTNANVSLEQRRTHDQNTDSVRALIAGHSGKLFIVEPPSVRRMFC